MSMHNPPHPGEFIEATYMEPYGFSCRYIAEQLNVAASTLNRILKEQSDVRKLKINAAIQAAAHWSLTLGVRRTYG